MTPYEKAIDQELICANIGCVCEGDDYETAQKNLSELIRWHVDVATDERVNGGYRLVLVDRQYL